MKCPYQLKIIHKQEHTKSYYIEPAEDITQFGECLKGECPFYYMENTTEHCSKAESEVKNDNKIR